MVYKTGLTKRIGMAVEHMLNSLDERRGYLPFFFYYLVSDPRMIHGPFDAPHVAGRCLDVLSKTNSIIDLSDELPQVPALTYYLQSSAEEDGLVWNIPTKSQPYEVITHNFRETLQGLTALGVWKDSNISFNLARNICVTVERITRENSALPGISYDSSGWHPASKNHWHGLPGDTGRMIGALVEYYSATNDALGIELALRFAIFHLEKSFTEEGEVREEAKPHVHSITGTLSGIAALALQLNDSNMMEKVKRIYDIGLKPIRTSHGYIKELWSPNDETLQLFFSKVPKRTLRGEANNTGDIIETVLCLANFGYSEYYQDAERMIRNHLLSSQLQDIDWIEESSDKEDTWEILYHGVAKRAKGGFGFCTPNDFIDFDNHPEGPDMNADLFGGAIRALYAALNNIVTAEHGTTKINLLFSTDTDYAKVESKVFSDGIVTITAKRKSAIFVRIPQYSDTKSLKVEKNGIQIAQAYYGPYLVIWDAAEADEIKITLSLSKDSTEETIEDYNFTFEWFGDAVTSVTPKGKFIDLYSNPPEDL